MADELLWPRQRALVMVEFGRVCGRTYRIPPKRKAYSFFGASVSDFDTAVLACKLGRNSTFNSHLMKAIGHSRRSSKFWPRVT
jgi:hypothetical protein